MRLLPTVLTLFLLLLAPSQVRAQDRSELQAAATVLPAGPSQDALHAALRLVRLRPVAPDSTLVSRPPLAQFRVRRPDSRADSTVVVSIDFLHN